MVLTLDNGQTITIYEQGNLLKQLKPYRLHIKSLI